MSPMLLMRNPATSTLVKKKHATMLRGHRHWSLPLPPWLRLLAALLVVGSVIIAIAKHTHTVLSPPATR